MEPAQAETLPGGESTAPVQPDPLRILLVEDNPADARIVQLTLEETHLGAVDVEWVDRLAPALDRLSEAPFDILLLDLGLPDSNGLEGIPPIRERAPHLPIVILTGDDDEEKALQALRTGSQDYLVKGRVDPDGISRAIRYSIERATAEARLRESEERFRAIFEHAPIGMALVSSEGRWAKVNRALCEFLGRPEADLLRRTWMDVTHPDDLELDLSNFHRICAGEGRRTYEREKRYVRADGKVVWGLLKTSLIEGRGGEPPYFITQIEDVTHRKHAELKLEETRKQLAASERLSVLGTLVSGVGHEVKTPLAYVANSAELACHLVHAEAESRPEVRDLAAQVAGCCEAILDGVSRIDGLVKGMRTFSAREPSKREPARLSDVLDAAIGLFRATHRGGVRVETEFVETPLLLLDQGPIQQVVLNLLTNAEEASGTGCVIHVAVRPVEGGAEIEVRDEGAGIPPEVQADMFEPFYTTKMGNTGLGLAITRRIVDDHGGTIDFESLPGQGTTFTIFLPAQPPTSHSREMLQGPEREKP